MGLSDSEDLMIFVCFVSLLILHQSQHYFSALETLLMRSTNPWYLLTYLLSYKTSVWRTDGRTDKIAAL